MQQPRKYNNNTNNTNNQNRMPRNKHRNNNGRNNNQNRSSGANGGAGQPQRRINLGQVTNQRDKFLNNARDAQHGGDRVLMEYYLQHADHYQRLINEYNEEQESRRQHHSEQITDTLEQEMGIAATDTSTAENTHNAPPKRESRRNNNSAAAAQHGATDNNAEAAIEEDALPMSLPLPPAIPQDTDDMEPKDAE